MAIISKYDSVPMEKDVELIVRMGDVCCSSYKKGFCYYRGYPELSTL